MRLAALLILCLAAPAGAMPRGPATPEQVAVTYRCEGGVEIPVIFINPPQSDAGYAAAVIQRRLMVLPLVASASGARYRGETPAPGYEIWVQGDAATISTGPAGQGQPVATGCRLAP